MNKQKKKKKKPNTRTPRSYSYFLSSLLCRFSSFGTSAHFHHYIVDIQQVEESRKRITQETAQPSLPRPPAQQQHYLFALGNGFT